METQRIPSLEWEIAIRLYSASPPAKHAALESFVENIAELADTTADSLRLHK
jgi:hypothetical protein